MYKPNKDKKDPSGVVYLDLINTKFKDYNKEYRRYWLVEGIPFNYFMNMWRDLDYDCDFWVFLLEHYKYHKQGHNEYHKIKQNQLQKIFNKLRDGTLVRK